MNYLEYLQSVLTTMNIYEETNYQYSGSGTDCVIKYLQGTNYLDSIVQPIQLSIYTDDVITARTAIESFAKSYTNTHIIDGTEYVTQFYNTPMVLSVGNMIGPNYSANIILSGTLLISSNVSEIKTVTIDGYDIETTTRTLSYSVVTDTQRNNNSLISNTDVKSPVVKFVCTFINKNNSLCQKLRRMRLGTLNPNTYFSLTLTYTDNDTTETFSTMKVIDYTLNSDNGGLPAMTVTFSK